MPPSASRPDDEPGRLPGPAVPRGRRRPARRDRVRRDLGVRAARRGRQAGADAGGQGRDRVDGGGRVRPRRRGCASGSPSSAPTRSRRWRRSAAPIDHFHEYTAPADWFEGLIKAYVGDGMANDFYREIAAYLDADTRDLIVASLEDSGHSAFVVDRVRAGDRRRPAPRRPAGAVGPPADGGGAHPGAAGRGRPRRADGAARRRRRPPRPRPGRASAGCSPGSPSGTPSGWPSSASTADPHATRRPRRADGPVSVAATITRTAAADDLPAVPPPVDAERAAGRRTAP